jgi:hypothetical protein
MAAAAADELASADREVDDASRDDVDAADAPPVAGPDVDGEPASNRAWRDAKDMSERSLACSCARTCRVAKRVPDGIGVGGAMLVVPAAVPAGGLALAVAVG